MSFCLDDGAGLLFGPAAPSTSSEGPATAILSKPFASDNPSPRETSAGEAGEPLRAAAGYSYAKLGQRDDALDNIRQWREIEKKRYIQNYWVAIAYAAIGDKDGAFAELEKAYQNRDWFLQRLKVDPFMDPLCDDPRHASLLKRIGLLEQHYETMP